MDGQPPSPPSGVGDLHVQPGLENDAGLRTLQDTLESELSDEAFDKVTQFADKDAVPAEPSAEYRERVLEYVTECITYRERIRPESLRELDELPDGISRTTAGGWVWYRNGSEGVEHDQPASEANTEQSGKYLFFAPGEARALLLNDAPGLPHYFYRKNSVLLGKIPPLRIRCKMRRFFLHSCPTRPHCSRRTGRSCAPRDAASS